MKKIQVGIIGSAGNEEYDFQKPNNAMLNAAEKLGIMFAKKNCIIVNGGKGGIMEAASRGASIAGGVVVGEISGNTRNQGNDYIDIEIVSYDQGFRGPSMLVGMCDVVVALGGGAGTLQELAVAYRMKRPVVLLIGYGGWTDRIAELEYLDERRLIKFVQTKSVSGAVKKALSLVEY